MNRNATIAIASTIFAIASFATAVDAAPPSANADSGWVQTNDEAGWSMVPRTFGATYMSTAPVDVKPLDIGDISVDRQYVYTGDEGGWQSRPVEYRLQGGRFVHVDDSVGRTPQLAEFPAATKGQRFAVGQLSGA